MLAHTWKEKSVVGRLIGEKRKTGVLHQHHPEIMTKLFVIVE